MANGTDELESMYAALRNVHDLEQREFRSVIKAIFNPTLRERYVTINYHRAAFNVEMLVAIKDTKQFQAIALLTRAVFELALEVRLIYEDKDAARKIELFSRLELLRSARKLVDLKKSHPGARFHYETHEEFIAKYGEHIDAERDAIWPSQPKKAKIPIKHWTGNSVLKRANDLGDPFDQIYNVHYAELSWMTHSRVVSPLNMTKEWVTSYVGLCYAIAVDSYMQLLECLVNEFKMYNADPLLKKKILCSRDLGFTSTEAAAVVLGRYGLAGL